MSLRTEDAGAAGCTLVLEHRTQAVDASARRGVSPKTIPNYEETTEERISELLGRIRSESFAPNPEADCQFCSFSTICPRWPQGGEVALEGAAP